MVLLNMPPFMTVFRLLVTAHATDHPLRMLLTLVGVALGVSASVAVRTANLEVLHSFEQAVLAVAGPTTLEVSGGDLGLEEELLLRVRKVPGVIAASPVILQTVRKPGDDTRDQVVQVLGLDLLAEFESRGIRLTARTSEEDLQWLLNPQSVFIGREVAAEWNAAIGDEVTLQLGPRRMPATVAGILEQASGRASTWDRLAVMDIAAAQIAFAMVGRLDRIDVITEPDHDVMAVADALRQVVPPHLTVERPASRSGQVEQMVRAFRVNLMVLSWVGLLVGIFLIYNTMSFAVAQRRREIGVYRALGMTPARVAVLFLLEAAALGLLGGLLGSLSGMLLARNLTGLVGRTIADLYVPLETNGALGLGPDFLVLCGEGVGIGCAVAMLGALGPSLDAGGTAPVRALAPGDYEARRRLRAGLLGVFGATCLLAAGLLSLADPIGGVPVFGYLATFCILAGLASLAPLCVVALQRTAQWHRPQRDGVQVAVRQIAVDHAARNPGRNGVTVSALMVGLAIMLGVVIMVRSFRHTVEIWINETVVADVVVAPSGWLRGSEAGSVGRTLPSSWMPVLAAIPAVAAVDGYRDVRVEVEGQRVALVSRDLRLHAARSRYLLRRGDSDEALIRAADVGGLLVSEVLATRLGVREGDTLTVTTPEGKRALPIVAVFYDYATDGGKLVMDRALYRTLWHDELVTVYPLYLQAGAPVDRVRADIVSALKLRDPDMHPPLLISNAELRREILDIFDRTFLLTYVLEAIAVVIAMLGIVNTLVTSVLERRREFATLRAIGASAAQIRQLVLWEAAYLGAVGIVLGAVGGGLLAVLLIKVINKQSFGWTIQLVVPMDAVWQAVGLAAAATVVAGYFPARWAARQPVVEGLREE